MKRIRSVQSLIGFFIQNEKYSVPVRCESYRYSEWLNIYFQAALAEDAELARIWKDPLVSQTEKDKLISEATEYFFITSLLSLFKKCFSVRNRTTTLTRNNIPEILRSNRFLELFSRPREQRPMFANVEINKELSIQFSSHEPNEAFAFFEEFCFTLPKRSRFLREGKWLILDTPLFKLQFHASYDGYAIGLPIDFARYYLGFKKNTARRVNAVIKTRIKLRALFYLRSWHLINDLFNGIELTEESFSKFHFFKKINWDQIYTQSRVIENILQSHLPDCKFKESVGRKLLLHNTIL
jgi:hypothetical protein